jgi:hypothetical protein
MANQTPSSPSPGTTPVIVFILQVGKDKINMGPLYQRFEFKGMMNGGYIVYGRFYDYALRVYKRLIKKGYLQTTRREPLKVTFQIKYGDNGKPPRRATKKQIAYITSMKSLGRTDSDAEIEFVAVDPASYYLNYGKASGGVYRGRLDQVMRKVVTDYAPDIDVEVSRTTDSDENRWWMMRQDPQSFLLSLTDWSASVTQNKTNWLFASDGKKLIIKEQALWVSRQIAYYRRTNRRNDILAWNIFADNSLTAVNTKLLAQGASAVSGRYLDRITDKDQKTLYVKDSTTSKKQIAKVTKDQSFSKPDDAEPPKSGWTSIQCIPEIYSAGELGIDYDQYIDGRPRAMYLNMVNQLLRMKITVLGSGHWSDSLGLGVDTIFLRWTLPSTKDTEQHWWTTGNWIVYGFHHRVHKGDWLLDLSCARFDHDAEGKKVGDKNKSKPTRTNPQSNNINNFS